MRDWKRGKRVEGQASRVRDKKRVPLPLFRNGRRGGAESFIHLALLREERRK